MLTLNLAMDEGAPAANEVEQVRRPAVPDDCFLGSRVLALHAAILTQPCRRQAARSCTFGCIVVHLVRWQATCYGGTVRRACPRHHSPSGETVIVPGPDGDWEDLANAWPRTVGERIRRHRLGRGLSRESLAHLIGRSERWLVKVEQAETEPRLSDLVRLAGVLKVDLQAELLVGRDAPSTWRDVATDESSMAQLGLTVATEPGMIGIRGRTADEWFEELKRRTFLQAGAVMAGEFAWIAAAADPALQALEALRRLGGAMAETVDGLGELVADLDARFYLEPPAHMQPRVLALVAYAGHLLSDSADVHRPDLLAVIGRGLAMSANAQFDLADLAAARASAGAAYAYGERAGDGVLMAWVRDFQGMMAGYAGDFGRSLGYIEEGRIHAPQRSGIGVRLLGGQARAYARQGRVDETLAVLRRAESEFAALRDGEVTGGIFGIGACQVPYIASSTTVWLEQPAMTAAAAREVIDFDAGPGGPGTSPTRLALARLNLAVALMQQRQVDEACQAASLALEASRPASAVLLRARELHERLVRQFPSAPEVGPLAEKLHSVAVPIRPSE